MEPRLKPQSFFRQRRLQQQLQVPDSPLKLGRHNSQQEISLRKIPTPEVPSGRIAHYLLNWQKITSDPWILQVVKGYELELLQEPTQHNIPISQASETTSTIISAEVEALVSKGAVCRVNRMMEPARC